MIKTPEVYALVTGGSKGIGKAIALALASRGNHLLLMARNEAELIQTAAEIREKYNVKIDIFAIDLTLADSAAQVFNWVEGKNYQVSILVNNAGFGAWGAFADLTLAAQMQMVDVNVSTLVKLCHLFTPMLKVQKAAYILNISSTAAYQALPTLAIYAASKSFVLSFSRAINYELRNTSVGVTCICPGPVETNFASRAGMNALDKMAQKFNMQPAEVAEMAVKAMFKRKTEVIPGFSNKIGAFAARLLAKRFLEKTAAGIYKV
ncbi:MAG: SDR family oxidoreductase [Pedobacter sp.]|uniref:SDR family NAD(P)-dependent oxidoreductase n=1 Tax=Pedobacter sp. TaxID=1411316 RepID=UPI002808FBAF|nr:SDR family oxidoreductase [Pedobacter sp.]MDQ8004045.1 SDR family oxidoreductase [Pedobacter sp.]